MPAIDTNRKNFETAKEQGNLVPVEKSIVVNPTPPIPTYPAAPNANLRTPLPAISVQQPDMQRQWQTGATPQQRISPMSLTSNPVAGAQTISNIIQTQVAGSSAPSATVADIEFISINKQTGIAYNVNLSDLDTLITLSNNAGGTVTLPGPGSSFSFVQNGHTLVSSDVGTVSMTNGQGNLIFLAVWSGRASVGTSFTVTDTKGNTWIPLYTVGDPGNTTQSAWYAQGVAAGANTITVTAIPGGGGTIQIDISVAEYSGIKTSASLDAFSQAFDASTNITTVTANDLVIFSPAGATGGAHTTLAPWTSRYNDGFQIIQDQIVATPGTLVNCAGVTSPAMTNGDPRALAAFKPSIPLVAFGFTAGWYTFIQNTGTGTFSLQSNASIDGSGANVSIGPKQGLLVVYDGTNWFTERGINLPIPISVVNGGTGAATLTAHNVLLGEGTSPVGFAPPLAPGTVLTSNGAGSDPTFQAPSTVSTTIGSNLLIGSFTVSDSADIRGLTIFSHIRGRDILNACQTWKPRWVFGTGQGAGTITATRTIVYKMNQVNPSGNLFQPYTLSAAANHVGSNTTYTGTNLGSLVPGVKLNIAGFANGNNNGTGFTVQSSTTTTLTVNNANGVTETHAGTAQLCVIAEQGGPPFVYVAPAGASDTYTQAWTMPLDPAFDYVVAAYFAVADTPIAIIAGVADTFANDGNQLKGATATGDFTTISVLGTLPAFTGYPTATLMHQFQVVT